MSILLSIEFQCSAVIAVQKLTPDLYPIEGKLHNRVESASLGKIELPPADQSIKRSSWDMSPQRPSKLKVMERFIRFGV